jgi:hypothetical protein
MNFFSVLTVLDCPLRSHLRGTVRLYTITLMKLHSILAGLLLALSCAAGTPPPDKLLPGDTLGFITVPDYGAAGSNWSKWAMGQLWKDAAMKPFKEKFLEKFKSDVVTPLEREFGVKFADYAGLARGQLTFAITSSGWDGKSEQKPGFLFLMDSKEKSDALQTNLTSLKKKWVDSGKQIKTEKIRDIEFTTLVFSSDDLSKTLDKAFPKPQESKDAAEPDPTKKPARKLEWLIGQSESLLILGDSAKEIEKILIRQSGGSVPSLSEQGSFAANYTALFRDAQAYGWVNLKTIFDTLSKQSKTPDNPPTGEPSLQLKPDKLLGALGLTALQTLSFNLRDSAEGCLVNVFLNAPEANRKGILKALSFEAKDSSPPPFIPADAVKFSRWRLDIQKAWNTLENMLVEINPQYAGLIKLVVDNAGKDKDPNFDLRKNLIANLGDDIISCEKAPRRPTLEDLDSPPSLYLVGSPRAEQLASALKAIGSILPQQNTKWKEREFLGRKVYSVSMPSVGKDGKKADRTLHYAASGGYTAFSFDVAMLEEYLRGPASKTLRETSGLAEAAQKIGGMGTGLFSYENQQESMRATLDILKKESGSLGNLFGSSPLAGRLGVKEDDKKFKDWVDFSLLPDFDKIAKYFHFMVWGGSVNAEGISIKMFSPTPPNFKK